MEEKLIRDSELAKATLRLLGVDKIYLLKANTDVLENRVYLYNNRYYKCIKNGTVSLPSEEYFIQLEIGVSSESNLTLSDIKKLIGIQ